MSRVEMEIPELGLQGLRLPELDRLRLEASVDELCLG